MFATAFLLLHAVGPYCFCYAEHWRTFFFDWGYIRNTLFKIGGFAYLGSDFIVQFFVTPFWGTFLYALLLTAISWLFERVLHEISGTLSYLPLALLPAVMTGALSFDINYGFPMTFALAVVMSFVAVESRIRKDTPRLIFAIASNIALFFLVGSATVAYSVMVLVIELFRSFRKSIPYFSLPLLTLLCAYASIQLCWQGSFRQSLSPQMYFLPLVIAPFKEFGPWLCAVVVVLAVCLLRSVHLNPGKHFPVMGIAGTAVAVAVTFFSSSLMDNGNEIIKECSYSILHKDWQRILDMPRKDVSNSLIFQNMIGIAMAETGVIGDEFFSFRIQDAKSLCVNDEYKNPHIYSMVSDVYYSMGYLALSQKFAFEANECFGNYSPRLLQRLVETNEALGYEEVGAKYRRLLSKTLFYGKWARDYVVDDKTAGCAVYGSGLCNDAPETYLEKVVEANPGHRQALDYLLTFCLLHRSIPRFIGYLDRFNVVDVYSGCLPEYYQEAVACYALNVDKSLLDRFNIDKEVAERYEEYERSNTKKNDYWHYLLKAYK